MTIEPDASGTRPDPSLLRDALVRGNHADVAVHAFDAVPSTNRWLAEFVRDGGSLPALCIADLQTQGVGRRGRSWLTGPGHLTLSLGRRFSLPARRFSMLSLVTGIGVADGLEQVTGLAVKLKWPNDVILADAKLGGLLCDAQQEKAGSVERPGDDAVGCWRVIGGIGVNVRDESGLAALGIGGTSLEAHGVQPVRRDTIAAAIACRVLDAWARFEHSGWEPFAARWQALDWLHDKEVRVIDAKGEFEGRAIGIDDDGALRVQRDDGVVAVHAAEVSVRPRT